MDPFNSQTTTGTTIMAVCYDGGVMVGADSRTSSGSIVSSRATNKIDQLHKKIFVCRSGVASHTQITCQYVQHWLNMHTIELDGDLPQVKTAAKLFQQIIYHNKGLVAGILCAGFDDVEGPQIYQIGLGGTVVPSRVALSGSGSVFIYGYADANYKENMTRAEAKEFLTNSISLAMSRDASSGGMVRLTDIHADGTDYDYVTYPNLPHH
eukprot:CAMPEP_0114990080 /NCGR_PEP_ID=MMETSP0216-20121206/10573_1 /TAXON_ID=223996 /ORGANISM="Protocruzia adherens, Strain Boccale" /LENGTH=208 /DNA_ID=CAMNT_0002353167 /DNA_START=97 /DNA_END=723 /DNA_ORIENTATION=+